MLACAESNFSNFKFEYLCKNEFLRKTILACLSGAQLGSIHEKNRGRKSRDTAPLIILLLDGKDHACTWSDILSSCLTTLEVPVHNDAGMCKNNACLAMEVGVTVCSYCKDYSLSVLQYLRMTLSTLVYHPIKGTH